MTSDPINAGPGQAPDRNRCPLCGEANECQMCTTDGYKGTCWCTRVRVPQELIERVPESARGQACLCAPCVHTFHRQSAPTMRMVAGPGDFLVEPGGRVVFTAQYHLRRGYCCGSGCRNCPYPESVRRSS